MTVIGRDLRVTLGGVPVLKGVDFRAEAGQVTAIVGPNGSGKTTLLRRLTGDVVQGGAVTLNGQDTAALRPWELAALRAVLPQATPLAFPFTVAEVVALGQSAGIHAHRPDLVARGLRAVGLEPMAGRLYQELSGGQQARAQLARVLIQVWEPVVDAVPRWLFLDEPVASLDIAHQIGVMRLMRDFANRGGGVVAVMHDLNLTALVADSMCLMHQGRLLAAGAPLHILTDDLLSQAYDCAVRVNTPPISAPYVLPRLS